ncbi:ecto-ADP-ribosyltransferase 4 [Coregonus clupeaformis]|uniref:ecto-ADP-ribosyltransferase 4 n=1 Tax=Coregonus clupeaformis TaxID=59861 RepID=UPI001BE016F1|nr:ecto-ADP-ribosyltransferase 4 [Coregonus clupeaformis]
MKMAIIAVWTFLLLTSGVAIAMKTGGCRSVSAPIPLNMVNTSVDDMYNGCRQEMSGLVENTYLEEERKTTKNFNASWTKAEKCARNRTIQDNLKLKHVQAICAYSAGHLEIYKDFNQACLTNKSIYTSSFKFHSLHFLLTEAILLLKQNPDQQGCYTTYRRTKIEFAGEVNKEIRFGSFASSSFLQNLTHFGEKSCFEIKTCFGAYLKSYPVMGEKEKEVLIPPYEVFNITAVIKKEKVKDLWCDVVYKLQSNKTQSDLNCKMVKSVQIG